MLVTCWYLRMVKGIECTKEQPLPIIELRASIIKVQLGAAIAESEADPE